MGSVLRARGYSQTNCKVYVSNIPVDILILNAYVRVSPEVVVDFCVGIWRVTIVYKPNK